MKGLRGVATAAACAAAMVSSAGCSRSGDAESTPTRDASSTTRPTSTFLALNQHLRELWTDHAVWMRSYVVAAAANQPDTPAASDRLLKNSGAVGGAIGQYYRGEASFRLTSLLKERVSLSIELVTAAKAGDEAAQNRLEERADQNAAQVADFLSQINPNWSRGTLNAMLKDHMAKTIGMVDARLNKRWDADVVAFDAFYAQALKLADTLADGLVRQFPDAFTR